MFPFNSLKVYQFSKQFVKDVRQLLKSQNFEYSVVDQLKRASLSIMLNIAEGTSRFSKLDQRRFYIISRGSVFECSSLLDFLAETENLDTKKHQLLISQLEEISAILYSLIRKME